MSESGSFTAALKSATDGYSVRELARRSGWARSTVHDWLKGTRVPGHPQLDDLLDAVQATDDVRRHVHGLRESADRTSGEVSGAGEPVSGDRPDAPEHPVVGNGPGASTGASTTPAEPVRRTGPRLLIGVALGLLMAFVAGLGVGRLLFGTPADATGNELPRAQIANTLGKGVVTHSEPSPEGADMASYFDGDEVGVVCLNPSGAEMTDDTMRMTRTVWALLDDGSWVPDMYLNTPKDWQPPQGPPAPYKAC